MSDFGSSLSVSMSAMRAQASRVRHVSENIANADTPGYRRKTITFRAEDGQITTGPVRLDSAPLSRIYDPSNPLADKTGHVMGSNINLMLEVADAQEAQRSYQANLKMFDQTRNMQSELIQLLRR